MYHSKQTTPYSILNIFIWLKWSLSILITFANYSSYRKTSHISRTLVGNKIVDNSDVVGALPIGAAPTAYLLST